MQVYAKSNGELLEKHVENSLNVFCSLKDSFPHIPDLCGVSDFWKYLFISVSFHDLGKVARGFQDSLNGIGWDYRHEILSTGFLLNLGLPSPHKENIAMCVLTHHLGWEHLKMKYRTWGLGENGGQERWREKVAEMQDNQGYLDYFVRRIEEWSTDFLNEEIQVPSDAVKVDRCQDAMLACAKVMAECDSFFPNKIYSILMRGLTITCDHLASGQIVSIRQGIKETYNKLINAKEVNELKKFQHKLLNTYSSVNLSAPTGTGKTAASLLWCQANQDANRRIFYVLPYVASINAMYNRLKSIFGQDEIGLLHHKATYTMYRDLLEQNYDANMSLKLAKELTNINKKIYRPIKVLTPYQIIKVFFGIKGFEPLLSEMTNGLFIFDEIHCYEPRTVALIVRSAKELVRYGARFIFMSATLPLFLRHLLQEATGPIPFATLDVNNQEEADILALTRHRVFIENGSIFQNFEDIKNALTDGKKVLIVCNTVGTAQKMYKEICQFAKNPLLLHGRFVARDRENTERKISQSDLLVGTQAIEVSLNFDFDTLFTEPAPLDALLQRFGRVNRFGRHKEPVPVCVYSEKESFGEEIYDPDRVSDTLKLLPQGEPLSNQMASDLVEKLYSKGYNSEEKTEYQQVYNHFDYVLQQLPIFDSSDFQEDFFDLIGSMEVVPVRFKEDFISLMDEHRYFDAIEYILPISKRQFAYLNRNGKIISERHQMFVDSKYDETLGLVLEK